MGVPPGNRPAVARDWFPYLNGTSQGPTPEDARKDDHIIRARCAPLSPASGFPVSWSQQVIHEISGLSGQTGQQHESAKRFPHDP
jgi:hypothetical protein